MIPEDRQYTEDHEWVKIENNVATLGITQHAADELGDIVFVELKDSGEEISVGDEIGSVESVKTVSGIYSPLSGKIVEVNQTSIDDPESINKSPQDTAWLIKVEFSGELPDSLMSAQEYQEIIAH